MRNLWVCVSLGWKTHGFIGQVLQPCEPESLPHPPSPLPAACSAGLQSYRWPRQANDLRRCLTIFLVLMLIYLVRYSSDRRGVRQPRYSTSKVSSPIKAWIGQTDFKPRSTPRVTPNTLNAWCSERRVCVSKDYWKLETKVGTDSSHPTPKCEFGPPEPRARARSIWLRKSRAGNCWLAAL